MNKARAALLLVCAAALSIALPSAGQIVKPIDPFSLFPPGTTYWANEHGSTMRIENLGKGSLRGGFTTAVGCGVGVEQPLTGGYSGNAVSFVVSFGAACPSTTAWSGTLIAGTPVKIKSLWHLALGGVPSWNSIVAGADNFTQIQRAQAAKVLQK
jgi:hypothetical protein